MLSSGRQVPLAARLLRGDGELAAVMEEVGEDPEYRESQERGREWIVSMIDQAAPGRFTDAEKHARASALLSASFLTMVLLEESTRFGRSYDEVTSTLTDMIVYGTIHRPPESER
jgi:hypothetical protein